jgi:Flp pilus assembly protein TadB
MPETVLAWLTSPNAARFAVRMGEMEFRSQDICILVIALAAAGLTALNLGKIAKSESRERYLFAALRRSQQYFEPPEEPRIPWYQWFGATIAASRIIGTAAQHRLLAALLAAGVKGHGHLAALVTAKIFVAIMFVPLCWLLIEWRHVFIGSVPVRSALLAGAAILGWRLPDVVLSRLAARRRDRLENGIPDALDLLVICAEAGLSLDHAIEQVARVLRSSNPEVAEEFAMTAAEMRISAVRDQAFDNLAERAGIASLRGIVAGSINRSGSARHSRHRCARWPPRCEPSGSRGLNSVPRACPSC